ncbi:FG-GAP-like repeat-containing protein [Streptomyces sp. NPDC059534]|uniref:FG-GAP-like repeat-containing protein n=1 Tax=Streptomyces sp. NPDC059534 TaxID=3346859 RepID=UPI00367AE84C
MRTSLLRRLATVAVTLGLGSLGLVSAGAAPARAADDCPSGYFCAWKGDGAGSMFKTNTNKATLGAWDNSFRSVINRTALIACLYDDPNYGVSRGYNTYEPREIYRTYMEPGSYSSLKFVRTARECEAAAYPYWYAQTAPRPGGFGDMNGDRRSDVLVRDTAGRLWFLPGDGSGRLAGSGGWNAFNAFTRHGDFSRDGREDVLAREKATGKLWLYPGSGTGGFGARKLMGGGWNGMSRITAFGDLTGDGRSDLLAVEKATGKLWLYPGTASGGLGARKLMGGGWQTMNGLVAVGDTNGDGRSDLYAREAATGKLWLYPGRAGYFGSRVLVGSGGWNAMDSLLGIGDWSGDARPDLLALDGDWLVQYQGTGAGGVRTGEQTTASWWSLNGAF